MSEPKITLAQVMKIAAERPTTPELEMAVLDFLDLADSEQRALLFREMCSISAQVNWLIKQATK